MTAPTKRTVYGGALLGLFVLLGGSLKAQGGPPANPPSTPTAAPPVEDAIDAGEMDSTDAMVPARRLVSWNEYEGKYFTIRAGGGFLVDYAAFAQDENSKDQIAVEPKGQLRDARFLFRGKLKFIESRSVTWSTGIMWNGPTHSWQFRQSGIMIALPEILGSIFIGRTKEGISMNKIMVGYHGWTSERATVNDAMLPILADGIKYLGYSPKAHLVWNAGFYGDWLNKNLAFSTYRRIGAGRLAYVKLSADGEKVFHVGTGLRYGTPENGQLQLRSRPEVYPAPYFIDTGKFDAENSKMLVPELYYRNGPWLFGAEYMVQKVDATASGNPLFHGGEWMASWIATKETRPYNVRCGCFDAVSPKRTVFEGGKGAWELVTRFSYTDLDSGTLRGGKFWRFTPVVNWHMSDNVRLEFSYGVGKLDRFGLGGITQFVQTRLQLSL